MKVSVYEVCIIEYHCDWILVTGFRIWSLSETVILCIWFWVSQALLWRRDLDFLQRWCTESHLQRPPPYFWPLSVGSDSPTPLPRCSALPSALSVSEPGHPLASATLAWFSRLPEARSGGSTPNFSLITPTSVLTAGGGLAPLCGWVRMQRGEILGWCYLSWKLLCIFSLGSFWRAWTQPPVASSNLRLSIFGEWIWIRETKSLEEESKLCQSKYDVTVKMEASVVICL